jgi:hypothetical protein
MRRVGRKLMITPEGVPESRPATRPLISALRAERAAGGGSFSRDAYSPRWKDISPDRDPGQQQPISALPCVRHVQMIISSEGESMVVQYRAQMIAKIPRGVGRVAIPKSVRGYERPD